ncbi:TOBE domain-containing protein [Glutamicibacter protophormiae]|nr:MULTISPECIES: TOBE domain-containing protein [Kocuria]MDN5632275.1 TOBE domain-containing protein [Kocuria sp.]RUP82250.1 helix-turn-helix domain-containing protein [Kocuria sp. HSID17590]RUQ11348.1 helix-turn-helix domain-containing protein [Kocuria sp. HSID17582]WNB88651.1 TOBE domain-containing protein [Glutamicibacter protophormiae]
MTFLRVAQAASFMGVSDDTVRRWIEQGTLTGQKNEAGHTVVDGAELAQYARRSAVQPQDPANVRSSARNRLVGLVTAVKSDPVMSQVEMQCGPHRIVSLMSTEAVEDLGLAPGSVATAVVKSTAVIVETEGKN